MKNAIKRILGSIMMLCCLIISNMHVSAEPVKSVNSATLEVYSYEVEEGILSAGESITLNMKIRNNSTISEAGNIVMTYTAVNDALYPVYGEDNQIYIKNIEPGRNVEISIPLMVAKNYNAEFAKLNLEFDYASAESVINNKVAINIPTYASGQLASESVIVAGNATVGVNALVSVRYKNGGNTDIKDAKLVFAGSVEEDCREIELPVINAGKTYTQDYYVRFSESGIQKLQISYEYTDSQENQYTIDCGEYVVNVTTAPAPMGETDVIVEQSSGMSTIMVQMLLLLIAAVAVIITVVLYFRKRK